ncbi:F-box protein CPR1-like [Silene latifolia]|uniref:F-box protein CPR1-like n=1 Tax=Silene latifolia TaxID=37657 RepID=UPI003D774981
MANIPTEVVESCILPRLPVKTLIRFKCVSNSWKTLISSSEFCRLHYRHANRLLVTSVDGDTLLEVHNLDSPLDPPFLCPYPDLEQLSRFREVTTILASCEFFVLVGYLAPHRVERLFLVNPSTLSYQGIIVQRGFNRGYVKYGLYFDEANDDCKVVRISDFDLRNDQYSWKIEIYSSKINKWRLIEDKLIVSSPFDRMEYFNSVACLNNLVYLITDPYVEQRIHCFDIQAERWRNDIVYPHEILYLEICVLNGSLCVLGIDTSNDEDLCTETYSVWVFNESDSFKETWVKLMSIVAKNCGVVSEYHPIAYRKGSQHELLCQRHYGGWELFCYDLKHKVATKPEEFNVVARHNSHYHLCKESLITFHGRLFGA